MNPSLALRRIPIVLAMAATLLPALGPGVGRIHAQVPDVALQAGRVDGVVMDARSGAPVAGAQVRVRGIGRADVSHADGGFHLENLPPGEHVLVVEMIGYATAELPVSVAAGRATELRIALEASALALPGIVVTGVGRERGLAETYRPTTVLSGPELDRQLGWSLAATLRDQQGISLQSFGPAPAQPVIRGMGGDRVLVLEDGQRTGDLSTTGPDHALGIDPAAAERIEVVRGPAGLLYGSNALGGVINVIREEIPRAPPEGIDGTITFAGAAVNRGLTAAGSVVAPLGPRLAMRAEASVRGSGDVRTPLGTLPRTDALGWNAALGVSWLPTWGFAGVSWREYHLDHGVPGEFQGEQIPGAHAGGADIESRRRVGRIQLGHFAGLGPFASLEVEGNVVHYVHREIEGTTGAGLPVVGTEFDQLTTTWNAVARHEHASGRVAREGAVGVFGAYRDLIAGGSFSGMRDARDWTLAVFVFEELALGRHRLQIGARYDRTQVEPLDLRPIDAGDAILRVRSRTFGDFSGSAAALFELREGWTLGASVARAFRTPSVSELYSAGPHLADFSYDIGNPELRSEVGLGLDLFLRVAHARLTLEANVFRNRIANFIHSRPTGRLDPRFDRFPLFLSTGADALFVGADGEARVALRPELVLEGTASWVQAEYQASGEPLPGIPPLNGSVRLRWERPAYFATIGWEGAARQDRVPFAVPDPTGSGPDLLPETPTAGHRLWHLGAGVRWSAGDLRHALTLSVDNLFDTTWRNHLSRVREVAPEAGRNLQLLYRLSF